MSLSFEYEVFIEEKEGLENVKIIEMYFFRGLSRKMSGINCQAKGFEVAVKRQTGDIIEHMTYYNKETASQKDIFLSLESFLKTSSADVLTESS